MDDLLKKLMTGGKTFLVLHLVLPAVAIVFMTIALSSYFAGRNYVKTAYATEGRIVGFEQDDLARPIVLFRDRSGSDRKLAPRRSRIQYPPPTRDLLNTEIEVLYRAGDAYYTPYEITGIFFTTLLYLVFAAGTVGISAIVFVVHTVVVLFRFLPKKKQPGR